MFGRAAGISSVVRIWRRVARRLRPSSSSRASTERMPTIVAIATGKKTMSAQMTTLLRNPGPEPHDEQRREREDRDRLGGHEIRRGEPLEQGAPGEPVAGDQPERRARRRSRGRSRRSSSRNAARSCRPATPRRSAAPTVSGAGRMNGGRPATTTTAFQTSDEDDEGADDREPGRAAHETSSAEARG